MFRSLLMEYKEILLKLTLIECELDDATNQLPEYDTNSDSRTSIDCAKDELYSLKSEIEKVISND